jgi:hypothetical protein
MKIKVLFSVLRQRHVRIPRNFGLGGLSEPRSRLRIANGIAASPEQDGTGEYSRRDTL